MNKNKRSVISSFVCAECTYSSQKWLGQCPQCQQWNTFDVQSRGYAGVVDKAPIITLSQLAASGPATFTPTLSVEFNRVLGGGFVVGQVILLGGEPGIGKSTFTLFQLLLLAEKGIKVVYASGEESPHQVYQRIERLISKNQLKKDKITKNLQLIGDIELPKVLASLEKKHPQVVAFDSVQSYMVPDVASFPGSMSQVRIVGQMITEWSKRTGVTSIIIGQITKSGSIAGPKILEHMVDTVLYLQKLDTQITRMLRCMKNRYGSTLEVGFFDMTAKGVVDKTDIEQLFVSRYQRGNDPGNSLGVTMQGHRPVLIEVQALVVEPQYQSAVRRIVEGVARSRIELILAVLSRYFSIVNFAQQDVFVKVTGGVKIKDPGLDLAIVAALMSSGVEKSLPEQSVYVGELSLLGYVTSCDSLQMRLQEAQRLQFRKIYLPVVSDMEHKNKYLCPVEHLRDIVLS